MSADAPRVSVVIPLYNSAAYVARALQSVLAQTESRFEVIVVDDGSSDGGAEIVRRFLEPRIRLVSQQHSGVSVARNRGLAEARAPWVGFLDADDEWLPEFLERTLSVTTSGSDLVGVFTNYVDSSARRAMLEPGPDAGRAIDDYFAFLLRHGLVGALISATVIRRDTLLECGGFGAHKGEDQDALCRIAWSGALFYLPRPLAVYHTDVPGSYTERQRREGPDFPGVVDTLAAWHANGRIPARLSLSSRRFATRLLALHVIELLNRGRKAEALELLGRRPELAELRVRERVRIAARLPVPPVWLARIVTTYRAISSQPGFESSRWVLAGYLGGQVTRLLAHLALARLLAPEVFGVVAIAGVVLQGLEMFTDVGAAAWLIRDERGGQQETVDTAFVAQAARGAIVAVLGLCLAGAIASLYAVPDLHRLIPVAALASLMTGLCSTSLHTALRHGNVRGPTLVELAAQAAAAAAMLVWASLSPTPWALVAGNLAWATARMVLSFRLSGEPHPRLRWDAEAGRSLLGFARWIWVGSAFYFVARQADRALLGGYLDLGLLGAYVLAVTLVDTLTTLNQRLARHVLLPALSRARREEPTRLVTRFYAARRALDSAFLPAALALTLFARPIVELLYGARYRDVAWILAILGVLAAMRCLSEPCEQMLVALGATRTIAVAQAGRACWLLGALPIAWRAFGVVGVVWAVGLSEVPVLVVLWVGLFNRGALRAKHELLAILTALAVALYAAPWYSQ